MSFRFKLQHIFLYTKLRVTCLGKQLLTLLLFYSPRVIDMVENEYSEVLFPYHECFGDLVILIRRPKPSPQAILQAVRLED
jgi:hypothetical protein